MTLTEQLTIETDGGARSRRSSEQARGIHAGAGAEAGERAARAALRTQVAKLEHELSGTVARMFPHIAPPLAGTAIGAAPCLLSLAELERQRDRLALSVGETQRLAAARAQFERDSWALLQRMKLEPGRYKFHRLPVRDLGQGGCGVWQVRPRLGLIGMLAGWWQVKLSSGCPLPRGSRSKRDPAPPSRASRRECAAGDRSWSRSSWSRSSAQPARN